MTGYPHTPGHRGIDTSVAAAESIAAQLGYLQRRAASTISAAAAGLSTDKLAALLGVRCRTVTLRTAIVWDAAEGAPQ